MAAADLPHRVEAVRRFNRFYTRQIGLLHEHLLRSPFSLAEARVIYELAHRAPTTATALSKELGLDAGYLSRIMRGFQKRSLLARKPSQTDGRQSLLSLTERGQEAFARLNAESRGEIESLLSALPEDGPARLVAAMQVIEGLLGAPPERTGAYRLRPHQPGDMGWVVHRHGVLYAREYGWDEHFEALVASIVAKFVQHYDPKRERSRGLGIGARLVNECVRFARHAGYRRIMLWTNSVLHAARHIYEAAGFRLVREDPHHSFGHDLIAQTWELGL